MDDPVRVQILESLNDLKCVALDLQLMKSLAPLDQFVHALVLTQLKQYVHILAVFKEMLEQADMVVLDGPVNLDLTHQLLLGSALGQT